jgi:hypothetical protein
VERDPGAVRSSQGFGYAWESLEDRPLGLDELLWISFGCIKYLLTSWIIPHFVRSNNTLYFSDLKCNMHIKTSGISFELSLEYGNYTLNVFKRPNS